MTARGRIAVAVATVALLGAAMAVPVSAEAAAQPRGRFERIPGLAGITKFRPAIADDTRQVKVILQLADQPVAAHVADAKERGATLSGLARAAVREQLRAQQAPLTDRIKALGATVLASYQDAYNGVAVKVAMKDLPALQSAPGVIAVHKVTVSKLNDVAGNQYIGGDKAWTSTGFTGKGVKVGIIDTGIDYTHADFAGPGTAAAYESNDPTVIEPGTFPTAKVVGGYDFVGDAYAAEDPAHDVPKPDPDPLDCNGHGSHVAGIAAGTGVLANQSTYPGPYDATTFTRTFAVGPGVAPEASIYAYKVFGCEGSVDNSIVVAALNRAMQDNVDVVNASLGSPFGTADDPEVAAFNALAQAGIVVVASAGNDGHNAYMTGAPASADRAIAVSALDASRQTVPGARAAFSKASSTVDLQDSNEAPLPTGPLPVVVLRNADGTISLGCDPAEYVAAHVTGALVVTQRGTCARTSRAIYGQQAGAAAVVMVNTDQAYPPMEGEITENADTGEKYHVTIPFLGAPGTVDVTTTLLAADGGTVSFTPIDIANPGYANLASFTSGGPRSGDSAVKPDVTAPGVSVLSAGVGTGFKAATISGTSQASPMTAGVAALLTQAHPTWSTERIKAAIMNTADPSLDKSYDVRISGAGVVQAQRAIATKGDILAGKGQSTLSYGAEALGRDYRETLPMTIENTGTAPISYTIGGTFDGNALGAAITASPRSVTVPANSRKTVRVTLSLRASAVAALPSADASNFGALVSIKGAVVAVPAQSKAGVYSLRVPFLVAPRGVSKIAVSPALPATGSATAKTSVIAVNLGVHQGNADIYSWGISDPKDSAGYIDVRAAGVQVLPGSALGGAADDRSLVFAVNMFGRWSNPATTEVDIPIDNNGDGHADAYVIGIDLGNATTGSYDGRFAALIVGADSTIIDAWVATAPMNSTTMELPVLASEVGLSSTKHAFGYSIAAFDVVNGGVPDTTASAVFDAWSPAVSTGEFVSLAPRSAQQIPLDFRPGAVASSKAKGWMVVSLDDPNGAAQADLVSVPRSRG